MLPKLERKKINSALRLQSDAEITPPVLLFSCKVPTSPSAKTMLCGMERGGNWEKRPFLSEDHFPLQFLLDAALEAHASTKPAEAPGQ